MDEVRIGIAGLGIAARQVLAAFETVEGATLAGVADLRREELDRFAEEYPGVRTFEDVADLCAWDGIDTVWVATPNHLHAEHTVMAAEAGKHVICEKPMATRLEDADRMVAAIEANGVHYVQGHSKIFRNGVRAMRQVIERGEIGNLLQIHTLMYNDWLRRPVTPDEVTEARGGGVAFRQGPHQIDIMRLLAGGRVRNVRAMAGRAWSPTYDIEGHYSALLEFENGCVGLCGFNGYGHLDVAELTWNIGEGGREHPEEQLWGPRPAAEGPVAPDVKYGLAQYSMPALKEAKGRRPPSHDFFGLTLVSGDKGDIRQSPEGIYLYTEQGRREIAVPKEGSSAGVGELLELMSCLREDRQAFPDAHWGRATLECVLAILESGRRGEQVALQHQTAVPDNVPLVFA